MDDERFRERLKAWRALPGELADLGYLGYPHPLDDKLDALCALYHESTAAQRGRLSALVIPDKVERQSGPAAIGNLLTYIRRCARRMSDAHDAEPLRLGLTVAALVGERADERDLIVALVFLRAGAMRVGISAPLAHQMLAQTFAQTHRDGADGVDGTQPRASRIVTGVFSSEEATIARIVAYHAGTG